MSRETTTGYTPDEDLKVHHENAIRLICKPFQSHESGYPEWPKNSSDEYARTDATEEERVIVLIQQNGRRDGPSNVIAALDFCGMSSEVIDNDFRHWADPEASRRGEGQDDVQGGHGNGGKCYMTQMFTDRSYIHTVKDGKGCIYGTIGGSIRLGYFPDRDQGQDFEVSDVRVELARALDEIGVNIGDLPSSALATLDKRRGFTLTVGRGAKGYDTGRVPTAQLMDDLVGHPQMRRTLEMCAVYWLANGKLMNGGVRLSLPDIPPLPGAEEPRVVVIPDTVVDPNTGEEVTTTNGDSPAGALTLRTSETRMWRGEKRSRHNIVYKGKSGYIGFKPVPEFDVTSTYRERIYGDCELLALEPFKMNDRAALASSPLVRALEDWIGEQIQAYAKEFEALDRRKHDQEEKDALAEMNAALDRWKNELLDKELSPDDGPGDGPGQDPPPPPPPPPSGDVARIELSLVFYRSGVGVALRPTVRAFDSTDKAVRPPALAWSSDDPGVATVDEDIRVVNTVAPGTANLQCRTFDGRITSNSVRLDVVDIIAISLGPSELEVPRGSRRHIEAKCELVDGEIATDVALQWVENDPAVARMSAVGMAYGFSEGSTEVTAEDDRCAAEGTVTVTVVAAEAGGGGGKAYPSVLVSEINADPDTGEDVVLSADDPPVHQRPHDVERNIWWINSAAPLASLYMTTARGFGPESREWRIYHLERYIDVIVQIAMSQGPEAEDQMDVGEWVARWGERASNIQAAAADGLTAFIQDGDLPA
jgi:hypothetical protein